MRYRLRQRSILTSKGRCSRGGLLGLGMYFMKYMTNMFKLDNKCWWFGTWSITPKLKQIRCPEGLHHLHHLVFHWVHPSVVGLRKRLQWCTVRFGITITNGLHHMWKPKLVWFLHHPKLLNLISLKILILYFSDTDRYCIFLKYVMWPQSSSHWSSDQGCRKELLEAARGPGMVWAAARPPWEALHWSPSWVWSQHCFDTKKTGLGCTCFWSMANY